MRNDIYILHLLAFAEISLFLMYFGERKNAFRDSDEKSAGCGIHLKKERKCGIMTPLPDPVELIQTSRL